MVFVDDTGIDNFAPDQYKCSSGRRGSFCFDSNRSRVLNPRRDLYISIFTAIPLLVILQTRIVSNTSRCSIKRRAATRGSLLTERDFHFNRFQVQSVVKYVINSVALLFPPFSQCEDNVRGEFDYVASQEAQLFSCINRYCFCAVLFLRAVISARYEIPVNEFVII